MPKTARRHKRRPGGARPSRRTVLESGGRVPPSLRAASRDGASGRLRRYGPDAREARPPWRRWPRGQGERGYPPAAGPGRSVSCSAGENA